MIALFGGTFDPVHLAHITLAQELKQHLQANEMRLLPCKQPAHRDMPIASSVDRLNMLNLAAQDTDLIVDDRELKRAKTSYTIDTLRDIRSKQNNHEKNEPLVLCMGADAFENLPDWYQWEDILTLSHIVVVSRPSSSDAYPLKLQKLLEEKQIVDSAELHKNPHGNIYLTQLSQIPLSSTSVREELSASRSPTNQPTLNSMLHPKVQRYIKEHMLYE